MEQSISFLIAQVCKAHRNSANALLQARAGLYAGQEFLLSCLAQNEGMPQGELAAQMCVEAPTLTRMVQRMGQSGLIKRSGDADDARVTRLYLTDKGKATLAQAQEVWAEVEARTVAALSDEEQKTLHRLLRKVQEGLNEEG